MFTLGGVGELGGEDDEAVEAVLEGGVEGLVRVEWSRTGNRLLGWSELGVSIGIFYLFLCWRLVDERGSEEEGEEVGGSEGRRRRAQPNELDLLPSFELPCFF